MKQENIEALKKNEKPFGLMSGELQQLLIDCTATHGPMAVERFVKDDNWIDCKDNDFSQWFTYRLRPDYEPDSVIVEWAIKNSMYWDNVGDHFLSDAINSPDFIGFKFEETRDIYATPIIYDFDEGDIVTVISRNHFKTGKAKVLHATHVLFRRSK